MKLIKVLRKTGEVGDCNKNEMMIFFPYFPQLKRSEFIFNIKW